MAPAMTVNGDGPRRVGSRLRAAFACLRIWVFTDSSADAASSRAALPAPLPSSFAARPTRSATSLPTCLKSTCFRSGTTRHPLGDLLGRFVLGGLDQVAVAQHAHQPAILRNRQAPDLFAFHLAPRLIDVVVRRDDRDLLAHHVLRGFASGVMPLSDAADHDVAVGNDPDHRAAVFNHRYEPGVFLLHLPGDVDHLVVLFGRCHGFGHRISDFQLGYLPWVGTFLRLHLHVSPTVYPKMISQLPISRRP